MMNMGSFRDLLAPGAQRYNDKEEGIDISIHVDWVKDRLELRQVDPVTKAEIREYPNCLSRQGIDDGIYKAEFYPALHDFARRVKRKG